MEKILYVQPEARVVRLACVQTLLTDSSTYSKTILEDYEEMNEDWWD